MTSLDSGFDSVVDGDSFSGMGVEVEDDALDADDLPADGSCGNTESRVDGIRRATIFEGFSFEAFIPPIGGDTLVDEVDEDIVDDSRSCLVGSVEAKYW